MQHGNGTHRPAAAPPTYLNYRTNGDDNQTQPIPIREAPIRVPRPSPPPTQASSPATAGLLLVILSSHPTPAFSHHVEILYSRRRFTGVTIISSESVQSYAKQLKMDVYALAGKLMREVSVETVVGDVCANGVLESLLERLGIHERANKETFVASKSPLAGVLCNISFEDSSSGESTNLLGLSPKQLESSWKASQHHFFAIVLHWSKLDP